MTIDQLKERYTTCKPWRAWGEPDAYNVWLEVGSQSFCVTPIACETEEEAEWFRTQLAKALAAIVAHSDKPDKSE